METLTSALNALKPPRPLTVQLLKSEPRRTQALFEHAPVHPRATVQDVLVLLYIHLPPDELPPPVGSSSSDADAKTKTRAASPAASAPPPSAVPVLLTAVQAQVYTLPASSTTVLYIAKADSSSFTLPPTLPRRPYAKTLLSAFLAHYLSPKTRATRRTFIQLFARSQAQYLFPDSGSNVSKRVLTGEKLCRWWKAALVDAVNQARKDGEVGEVRADYVLPGMSSHEASLMVGPTTDTFPWTYGMRDLPPILLPIDASLNKDLEGKKEVGSTNSAPVQTLAEMIPTFEDDPRTRFLTDLTLPPGAAPAPLSASSSGISKPRLTATAEASDDEDDRNPSSASPLKAQQSTLKQTVSQVRRQKASAKLKDMNEETFWELLAFRQECSLGATVGFFSLASLLPPTTQLALDDQTGALPKAVWLRVIATLLNQSFATDPLVVRGSQTVWQLTRTLAKEVVRLDSVEGSVLACQQVENDQTVGEKRKGVEVLKEEPPVKKLMAVRKKKKAD